MPNPITVEELLRLIRQSGIVEGPVLAQFLDGKSWDTRADARNFATELVEAGVLTKFQSEQLLQGKWRGFTIGRYKYLERIGVGGMGQVFLCEHVHTRQRVAVKVLPPAKAEQPAALGRFYREARAAAALQHPNVVRIHDIDQDGELHFIVMDYIAGPNLLDLVKRFGPLDIGRATSYVHQVAGALDFAFRNGIIHRDVKPGNVMIDRSGRAYLLDLGLARFLNDHGDQLTLKYDDKIVLGTADYVAPEQIENSHAVDTRADLYALGSTFYFLLAGHPPFPTGTVSQKLLWHRTRTPTPIREIRPEVPAGIADVLAKMMARDPKERYQTPAQLMSDLEGWVPSSIPLPRTEELPSLGVRTVPKKVEPCEADKSVPDTFSKTRMEPDVALSPERECPAPLSAREQRPEAMGAIRACLLPTPNPRQPKRLSESETEESTSLMTTPSPRLSARSRTRTRRQLPPSRRSSIRWGVVGVVMIALLVAVLVLIQ